MMTPELLEKIRGRAARWSALYPIAEPLEKDINALLDEVERLQKLLQCEYQAIWHKSHPGYGRDRNF